MYVGWVCQAYARYLVARGCAQGIWVVPDLGTLYLLSVVDDAAERAPRFEKVKKSNARILCRFHV